MSRTAMVESERHPVVIGLEDVASVLLLGLGPPGRNPWEEVSKDLQWGEGEPGEGEEDGDRSSAI